MAFGTMRISATPGPSSSAPGGAPSYYNPAYGGVPNLPQYVTDTTKMVGTDVQAQMAQNLPGYLGMSAADSANIQQNLAGYVPPDVVKLMQQQAAERGIATGMPGAGIGNAAYLRALGLTSLQLQQLGHSQLTEAMQRTPIQQMQTTTATRDLGAERAVYAAAPSPQAAAEQALRNAQMGMGTGQKLAGGVPAIGGGNPAGAYTRPVAGAPGYEWSGQPLSSLGPYYTPTAPNYDQWLQDYGVKQPAYEYSPPSVPDYYEAPYAVNQAPTMWSAPQTYGLPTWQDTSSMMGYNLPSLAAPQPYQYYDEPLAEAALQQYESGG